MTLSQQPRQFAGNGPAHAAHERRRRAAWLDYLRATREVAPAEYEAVEAEAWELLQRRLRRNDELLAAGQS